MNDKFLNDALNTPKVDKAIADGTFEHHFLIDIITDDNGEMHFRTRSGGTNETSQGDMFALVEAAYATFETYSKEYEIPFRDCVEHFLMHLSDRRHFEKEA